MSNKRYYLFHLCSMSIALIQYLLAGAEITRNPFYYVSAQLPLRCNSYAVIETCGNNVVQSNVVTNNAVTSKKITSAEVVFENKRMRIMPNDSVGSYIVKEVRPEGLVISDSKHNQLFIRYDY